MYRREKKKLNIKWYCNGFLQTQYKYTIKGYICELPSKNVNNLNKRSEMDLESVKFRLSILHAKIRIFKSSLYLSYKLSMKKWQIRTTEEKKIIKQRKEQIEHSFRDEMGILVDISRVWLGKTNYSYTSRRFLSMKPLLFYFLEQNNFGQTFSVNTSMCVCLNGKIQYC